MTCVQSVDVGDPIMRRTYEWPTHAWIIDLDRFDGGKYTRITLTRTYRCVRCGKAWQVTGEPSPAPA